MDSTTTNSEGERLAGTSTTFSPGSAHDNDKYTTARPATAEAGLDELHVENEEDVEGNSSGHHNNEPTENDDGSDSDLAHGPTWKQLANMERDQQDTECIWCGRKASAKCQGCQSAVYCDSACQKKDWAVHMRICKESRSIGRRPSRAARLELFLLKIHKPELRWIASYDERKAIMGRGSCSGSSVLHNARLCKDIKAEYTCFYDGNSFGNTGYNLTINTINNGDTVDDHRIRGAGTRLEHRGVWLA